MWSGERATREPGPQGQPPWVGSHFFPQTGLLSLPSLEAELQCCSSCRCLEWLCSRRTQHFQNWGCGDPSPRAPHTGSTENSPAPRRYKTMAAGLESSGVRSLRHTSGLPPLLPDPQSVLRRTQLDSSSGTKCRPGGGTPVFGYNRVFTIVFDKKGEGQMQTGMRPVRHPFPPVSPTALRHSPLNMVHLSL